MQITVAGKQVDTGDAIRFHVERGLSTIADKYFDQALEARVVFSKDRGFFACDINLHAGRNVTMQGHGTGTDAHRAFDEACDHVGKRLRRYRRRVNEHARSRANQHMVRSSMPILSAPLTREIDEDDEMEIPNDMMGPAVVAEAAALQRLTVSQAALQLDGHGAPLLMFRNHASGEVNVVYRRPDGHVGWLDPGM